MNRSTTFSWALNETCSTPIVSGVFRSWGLVLCQLPLIKPRWPIAKNENDVLLNAFVERCVDADGCSVTVVGQALQRVLYAVNKMCISHCTYLPCVVVSSIHQLNHSFCTRRKKALTSGRRSGKNFRQCNWGSNTGSLIVRNIAL